MGLWILAAVFGIATLPALTRAVRDSRRRAEVQARMMQVTEGLADHAVVTIRGTVRLAGKSIEAPLSGTACVAHQSRLRVYSAKASFGVRAEIDSDAQSELVAFVLATKDGDVLVEGSSVDIVLPPRPVIPRKLEREAAFMRALGFEQGPADAGFDEAIVVEGMKITVNGIARLEVTAATDGDYRQAPSRVRVSGDDQHPLTIGRG